MSPHAPTTRSPESKPTKGSGMAKRSSAGAVICPRCGVPSARVVGRSESHPVVYLRCDECGKMSVLPSE